jgi:hypothetical protein
MPIILATWEAEIQSISIQGLPRQKVHDTPFQPVAGCGGAATQGSTNRIMVQAGQGTKWTLSQKQPMQKGLGERLK